jgi:Uma2 family endonuclease
MDKDVSINPRLRITPQEYLDLERKAEVKSEYMDGEMFAMSGASREHARIVLNIASHLNSEFQGRPCEVYASELRTKITQTGSYTYPDVVAVCGGAVFEDDYFDTLINPQLIVEVLSDSTESYDRGRKFAHYRTVESLLQYVLVSQTECRVECFKRQSDDANWLYTEAARLEESVELSSVATRISLAQIYQNIDFEAARVRPKRNPQPTAS